RDRALDHLYQGQSNDCYWHGLFGGIYISHMRLATHEHLIAAEDLAETVTGTLHHAETRDLDMDGVDEVLLADDGQVVAVDLDGGAGIGSWDIRSVRHALAAVMRRRPEAYHATLLALHETVHEPAGVAAVAEGASGVAPASIHDTVRVKEPGLAARLVYDTYERRSGLVRALPLGSTAGDWAMARATELGDAVDGPFELVELAAGRLVTRRLATIADSAIAVTKTLTLGGNRRAPTLSLQVDLDHRDGGAIEARIGVEWSLTMLGGGGNPAAWWDVRGERTAHDIDGTASELSTIAQGNDYIGISVTSTTAAADAWWAPIETISNSEGGFERMYQGSALLLSWPVRLAPGEHWTRTISHVVATTHDRASEAP
ncbi:MAG TPA: alpha-amylase/4-alpha-glucanotransferase domain-containing protein, partial [Candidatus Limnocylindrales bacterium]|nr:alpha-amylase/4-alpha-glucanotransferase domain-containing protein [Candidatus Limnocylindrales bacterium]